MDKRSQVEDDGEGLGTKILADDVLRKIGRNVVIFQQIEGLLKFLVANQRVDGARANFIERHRRRAEEVQKQTMGTLVQRYMDAVLSDAGEPLTEQENVNEAWISASFTIKGGGDFYESLPANLKLMVDERNNLVHHLLSGWQPDSPEYLAAALSYLDQQHDKVLPLFEHLKSVTGSMEEHRQAMAKFLTSEEGRRQLKLQLLQASPLVSLLREVAAQAARADGWTYLAHAGRLAHKYEPDAVTHIKERYGYSTLKQLVIASEEFDVLDEPLANGSLRTAYRVKTAPQVD